MDIAQKAIDSSLVCITQSLTIGITPVWVITIVFFITYRPNNILLLKDSRRYLYCDMPYFDYYIEKREIAVNKSSYIAKGRDSS